MGDDDDDGDADDSPTTQYIQQDTLKGKCDPEGSQVTRPKLEMPEVRPMLFSRPLLTYPPSLPARFPATSPPSGITTHFLIDSPHLRRQAHQAPRIRQPSYRFIITIHHAISKSSKTCQGGRAPDITRVGYLHPSIRFRPHTLTLFACCPFACAAASPTTSSTCFVLTWIVPRVRLASFADSAAR